MSSIYGRGTIQPSDNFNSERAAAKLRRAMKGIGTDERIVIDILTNHSNDQRQEIKAKYQSMYGRDLIEDLRAELGGHFEDVCTALLIPKYEYLAECLYRAVKGAGTDENCIIEILCTHECWEIKEIRKIFREVYEEDLIKFLCHDLSGDFKKIIKALANANREEADKVDDDLAEKEAQKLFDAGVGKSWGTDTEVFLPILCSRSYPQLRLIFEAYERISGHCLSAAIENEFEGDVRRVFLAIVHSITDTWDYFAHQLNECMSGPGTNDRTLIRILVSRSEIDLEDIKRVFRKTFEKDLTEAIAEDTSGDYRKILLRIIRN
ncbi:annexin-B12-like [Centruroides sculpturatus]|uniref:annexin-B12-like n=1 Tax=Centruroides sculpturatus TaxID=218467 RepID=UPI000C6D0506|nr:annexin-B12-like [Centruroides sculpturatus]